LASLCAPPAGSAVILKSRFARYLSRLSITPG
jgi:hypothetical protein